MHNKALLRRDFDVIESHQVNAGTDALIVVDVQRDFCPGGVLAVPDGDDVVPVLNEWLRAAGLLKLATRDWHPPDHCSFEPQGGPWPPHCVRNTPGAELHPDLEGARIEHLIAKGTDATREAYSGFDSPELLALLKKHGIRRLWIGGLATDYCVKATVLDGRENGFEVFVIEDGIRGIDVTPGDVAQASQQMQQAGARFVRSNQVRKA